MQTLKQIPESTYAHMIRTIPFITDVDFVPYSEKDYQKLPRALRTEALRLLKIRRDNWASLVADRKAEYE